MLYQRVTLSFAMLALVNISNAQVSIGHRAGLSVSMWRSTIDKDDNEDRDLCLGLATAIPVEITLSDHFALQPELAYTQKGQKQSYGSGSNSTVRLHYLEVQCLAKYGIGRGPSRANVMLGPSLGRGLLAIYRSTSAPYYAFDAVDAADFGPGKYEFRMVELSAVAGLGIVAGNGRGRFTFDLRYVHALTPIYNDDIEYYDVNGQLIVKQSGNIFNQTFLFQVGYLLSLGDDPAPEVPAKPGPRFPEVR